MEPLTDEELNRYARAAMNDGDTLLSEAVNRLIAELRALREATRKFISDFGADSYVRPSEEQLAAGIPAYRSLLELRDLLPKNDPSAA